MIQGALSRDIPESQIASWLMAIFFRGMNTEESTHLTRVMIDSGQRIALDPNRGPYVDKHSTGGVGDGVSLSLAPIAAACGLYVPMVSGRALGHTGGTLDKLDSIPGYRTELSIDTFAAVVSEVGYAMSGQSRTVVPADKQLYALRDVTGTVESVPLIVASILSKKIAEGAEVLILDVKSGSGAFFKRYQDARRLGEQLVRIGGALGITVAALITRMEQPLGRMIGNFLEVEQAAVILGGYSDNDYDPLLLADIREVTVQLAVAMLTESLVAPNAEQARAQVQEAINSGRAWERFCHNVKVQGGDAAELQRSWGRRRSRACYHFKAPISGYIQSLPAHAFGVAAVHLGVGRLKSSDSVQPEAGIALYYKEGMHIARGETLCTLYTDTSATAQEAANILRNAVIISEHPTDTPSDLIIDRLPA